MKHAIRLFGERGYDAVSTRDITKACRIGPATLYHYFPNKQAIYQAALGSAAGNGSQILTAELMGAGKPVKRLRLYFERWVDFIASGRPDAKLLSRELFEQRSRHIGSLARDVFRPPHDLLVLLLSELSPRPIGAAKLERMAMLITGMAYGSVQLREVHGTYKSVGERRTSGDLVTDLTHHVLLTVSGLFATASSR